MQLEKTGNLIKAIKINKNNVKLVFDNGKKLYINKNTYASSFLYVGKLLSDKEIKQLTKEDEDDKYYSYALKLLSKKQYFKYKFKEKLILKFPEILDKEVYIVIDKLTKNNLLNDERLKDEYIDYYNSLNYGENKIKNKLIEKGYDYKLTKELVFPFNEEIKKAKNNLIKLNKKFDKYNSKTKKDKIAKSLIELGFSFELIDSVIKNVKENSYEKELELLNKDYNKLLISYSKKYQDKELKQKLINKLLTKGYKYKDILQIMEEQ
ncbi:MAG: hypothetical protein ACI31G_02835 [Bacilli bacterium]